MAYKVTDISNWFINRALWDANSNFGDYMTNLKLQKLLYYAQGTYGAMCDKPLFDENIVHWQHGPVVVEAYEYVKALKEKEVDEYYDPCNSIKQGIDSQGFDKKTNGILMEVYDVFGQYSAWKLRDMTHEEDPWRNTKFKEVIPFEVIKDYFKREWIEK